MKSSVKIDPVVEACKRLSKRKGAKSLAEIAHEAKVTPSAIFQIEQKALKNFFRKWMLKYKEFPLGFTVQAGKGRFMRRGIS